MQVNLVSSYAPSDGDILKWNNVSNEWQPSQLGIPPENVWLSWNGVDLTQFDTKVDGTDITSSTISVVNFQGVNWIKFEIIADNTHGTDNLYVAARSTVLPISKTPFPDDFLMTATVVAENSITIGSPPHALLCYNYTALQNSYIADWKIRYSGFNSHKNIYKSGINGGDPYLSEEVLTGALFNKTGLNNNSGDMADELAIRLEIFKDNLGIMGNSQFETQTYDENPLTGGKFAIGAASSTGSLSHIIYMKDITIWEPPFPRWFNKNY